MFVLICRDKPGHLEVRKANRDAHLAYLAETGIVRLAGPLLDDAGGMIGSMLAIEAADRAAAEAFAAADPYAKAGLFASVEIMAWKKVVG
jgi:uncharacterized protein YciI